jgi:benzylsuccinate CoA-transferase BbsF subunit
VLDFSWLAAGPYATLLLGLLGAEVVKVESSRRIDLARMGFFNRYEGIERSPNFNELNLNKRSVTIDLTDPRGVDLAWRLADKCDIVVDNFRPGVMQRLGLGPEELLTRFPHMIVASSSAYGATGPAAHAAGTAQTFAAAGGLSAQTGEGDGPPVLFGDSIDYRSGAVLAVAILAAVLHRDRTGQGQQIDLASSEVCATLSPDALLAHSAGIEIQARVGNGHRWYSPHNLYRAAGVDEWIAIAVTCGAEWRALCDVIGRTEWADQFSAVADRRSAGPVIDAAIEQWTSRHSAADAMDRLQRGGITSAPSFASDRLVADPHVIARQTFVEVEHPVLGSQTVMRAPWLLSSWPCDIQRSAPLMGEHNHEVLTELVGLSEDEIAEYSEILK